MCVCDCARARWHLTHSMCRCAFFIAESACIYYGNEVFRLVIAVQQSLLLWLLYKGSPLLWLLYDGLFCCSCRTSGLFCSGCCTVVSFVLAAVLWSLLLWLLYCGLFCCGCCTVVSFAVAAVLWSLLLWLLYCGLFYCGYCTMVSFVAAAVQVVSFAVAGCTVVSFARHVELFVVWRMTIFHYDYYSFHKATDAQSTKPV